MALKFHFFTDVDTKLLNSQSSGDAFGSTGIVGSNDTFLVTSKHTATIDPNAYAVCDGIVFIQGDLGSNGNLVNLILKPIQQPPFAFPKIKFIIYRGIRIDSLIDNNLTDIAPSNTNDLTKSLWDSQTAKNISSRM